MSDAPMSEAELEKFVGVLRKRQSLVEHLIQVADNVCRKLEDGQIVPVVQQEGFRAAIIAVQTSRLVGS
jgi:hypothetical protein